MYVWVGWVRERERERVRESEIAEMYTHRANSAVLLWNLYPFLLCPTWVEIFIYNFPDAHAIHKVTPLARGHASYQTRHPHTQLMQHFHWGCACVQFILETSAYLFVSHAQLTQHFHWGCTCVLFILGNKCIPFYATQVTYVECQRDFQVNIQH